MLDLVFKNYTTLESPGEKFFKEILDTGIRKLKIKNKKIEVSVNLVGEAKIKELNKKYRKKNKVTDVLSFPMNERNDLGDIFICLSFAKREAKSENVSIGYKLAQLTVHGFLHLLGYDHERSEKDEIEMFKLEESILAKCSKSND